MQRWCFVVRGSRDTTVLTSRELDAPEFDPTPWLSDFNLADTQEMNSHHLRSDASADPYRDMMTRFLGSLIMQAFDDPDVTEVYTNPHDQRIWLITHSAGRVNTGARIEASSVLSFYVRET